MKDLENIVVSFCRMNPITTGHMKLINKMLEVAIEQNATPILYLSQKVDNKKNPLTWPERINYLNIACPDIPISIDNTIKDSFNLAQRCSSVGIKKFIFIAGSDRVEEYKRLFEKWSNPSAGKFQLKFDKIQVISAGERNSTNDNIISGTKMRNFVTNNNIEEFKNGLPERLKYDYINIFNLLKTRLI